MCCSDRLTAVGSDEKDVDVYRSVRAVTVLTRAVDAGAAAWSTRLSGSARTFRSRSADRVAAVTTSRSDSVRAMWSRVGRSRRAATVCRWHQAQPGTDVHGQDQPPARRGSGSPPHR
jgi:hypothetical protein